MACNLSTTRNDSQRLAKTRNIAVRNLSSALLVMHSVYGGLLTSSLRSDGPQTKWEKMRSQQKPEICMCQKPCWTHEIYYMKSLEMYYIVLQYWNLHFDIDFYWRLQGKARCELSKLRVLRRTADVSKHERSAGSEGKWGRGKDAKKETRRRKK